MKKYSYEWFGQKLMELNSDNNFKEAFKNINSTFQIQINEELFTFYAYDHKIQTVTNKKVYHDTDFLIKGNEEVWDKIIDQKIGITQALHPYYKELTMNGSAVSFQSNLYFIVQFVKFLNNSAKVA